MSKLEKVMKFFGHDNKRKFFTSVVFDIVLLIVLTLLLLQARDCTCVQGAIKYAEYLAGNYTFVPINVPVSDINISPFP